MGADSRKRHKEFFATAPRGLEELLVADLRAGGIADPRATAGGAVFTGDLEDAYRACLWSRVAGRILLLLADIPARDEAQLHAGIIDLPWEDPTGRRRDRPHEICPSAFRLHDNPGSAP